MYTNEYDNEKNFQYGKSNNITLIMVPEIFGINLKIYRSFNFWSVNDFI